MSDASERTKKRMWLYQRVCRAIENGDLARGPCESCGADENIRAHHDDYEKPLDVRWFCQRCHIVWHQKHGVPVTGSDRAEKYRHGGPRKMSVPYAIGPSSLPPVSMAQVSIETGGSKSQPYNLARHHKLMIHPSASHTLCVTRESLDAYLASQKEPQEMLLPGIDTE